MQIAKSKLMLEKVQDVFWHFWHSIRKIENIRWEVQTTNKLTEADSSWLKLTKTNPNKLKKKFSCLSDSNKLKISLSLSLSLPLSLSLSLSLFLMKFHVHILNLQGPLRKFQVHSYPNSIVADIILKSSHFKITS